MVTEVSMCPRRRRPVTVLASVTRSPTTLLRARSALAPTLTFLAGSLGRGASQGVAALLVAGTLGSIEFGRLALAQVALILAVETTSAGFYVLAMRAGGDPEEGSAESYRVSLVDVLLLGLASGVFSATLTGVFAGYRAGFIALVFAATALASIGSSLTKLLVADRTTARQLGRVPLLESARGLLTLLGAALFVVLDDQTAEHWFGALIFVSLGHLSFLVATERVRLRAALVPVCDRTATRICRVLSLGGGAAATIVLRLGDQALLAWLADLRSVGTYAVAARLADMGAMVVAARTRADHQKLSRLASKPSLLQQITSSTRSAATVGLFASAGVVIASVATTAMLTAYPSLVLATSILALALPLRGANLIVGFGLMVSDRVGTRNLCVIVALTFNLLSNLAVIPLLGFVGAALTTAASELLLYGGLRWAAGRNSSKPLAQPTPSRRDESGLQSAPT